MVVEWHGKPRDAPAADDPFMDEMSNDITVAVSDVPPDASAAVVVLGDNGDTTMDLTGDLEAGMTQFDIPPPD